MKVLLVDDHPLILSALQAMIQELDPDVRVTAVGSASAARSALAADADFDLVLLDLQLGDASGFDVLVEMRKAHPALPVVVISASDRASDVIQAIDLGAMGFVPKRASNDTLVEALRLVMAGGIYVPPMHLGANVGSGPGQRLAAIPAADAPGYQVTPSFEELGLTPRQADVLTQLLQGKPNKEIARRLGLSVETVKDHVQAVLRALGVSSRTQAVLAVSQMTQQRLERRALAR
ncbi:MAG TPA: response regulator transcription factor [Burkholderiaceae bacterium]